MERAFWPLPEPFSIKLNFFWLIVKNNKLDFFCKTHLQVHFFHLRSDNHLSMINLSTIVRYYIYYSSNRHSFVHFAKVEIKGKLNWLRSEKKLMIITFLNIITCHYRYCRWFFCNIHTPVFIETPFCIK